jgi:hypothetical protein
VDGLLLTAVANVVLAMNGEPEPRASDLTADVARRLNALAARLREEA